MCSTVCGCAGAGISVKKAVRIAARPDSDIDLIKRSVVHAFKVTPFPAAVHPTFVKNTFAIGFKRGSKDYRLIIVGAPNNK